MARKTYRRKYSRKGKKYTRKAKNTRKAKKYTRKARKGGNGDDKVNCCMCGKEIKISEGLIPRVCLDKYGSRAHRICVSCWFNGEDAFAKEDRKHGCPGCEKDLPLTKVSENTEVPQTQGEIIDLTEE